MQPASPEQADGGRDGLMQTFRRQFGQLHRLETLVERAKDEGRFQHMGRLLLRQARAERCLERLAVEIVHACIEEAA